MSRTRAIPGTRKRFSRALAATRQAALAASCAMALLMLGVATFGQRAYAGEVEFRVIVHPSNPLVNAKRELVADVFLKKTTRWPQGGAIRPVDLRQDSAVRRRFSGSVLKRSLAAIRSYWQQRIFSGRDVPPPEMEDDEAVTRYVSQNAGAIGYVSASAQLAGTKQLVVE